jgi:hypothetical protein
METIAQPAKTLKQLLIGTWDQVVSEVTTPDGKNRFRLKKSQTAC